MAERSGINSITSFDPSVFRVRCAGEITDWNPEEFFSPQRLKRLDRYAQFAVVSAKLALEDARIEYSRENPQDRVGVSFGTALGGVCKAEEQYIRYLKKGARGVQPTLAVQVFGGSAHSNIAIEFGFRGVGTTNSNSCASGTVSVGEAIRYIRDDFADVVVAGGAEAPLTAITIGAFDIIKTMSRWAGDPALACRPFDALRDGFVMGEGGASLVIEELEHARARGAHIYAEVLGYSLNNDAFHMTTPLPSRSTTSTLTPVRPSSTTARKPRRSNKSLASMHSGFLSVERKVITPTRSARPARSKRRFALCRWIGNGFRRRSTIGIPIRRAISTLCQTMAGRPS